MFSFGTKCRVYKWSDELLSTTPICTWVITVIFSKLQSQICLQLYMNYAYQTYLLPFMNNLKLCTSGTYHLLNGTIYAGIPKTLIELWSKHTMADLYQHRLILPGAPRQVYVEPLCPRPLSCFHRCFSSI